MTKKTAKARDDRTRISFMLAEMVKELDADDRGNPDQKAFLRRLANEINEHMQINAPEDTWVLDEEGNIRSPSRGLVLSLHDGDEDQQEKETRFDSKELRQPDHL